MYRINAAQAQAQIISNEAESLIQMIDLVIGKFRTLRAMATYSHQDEAAAELVCEINGFSRRACDKAEELGILKSDRIRHSHREELAAVIKLNAFVEEVLLSNAKAAVA